ncbi:hypothetical protein AMECASPLE_012042 [Ameca splendens]|uniref:Uncharacterized protein n=1 Tax=Ameca splendens TaxID=208324 RepID=A0ABV1A845_9TELE
MSRGRETTSLSLLGTLWKQFASGDLRDVLALGCNPDQSPASSLVPNVRCLSPFLNKMTHLRPGYGISGNNKKADSHNSWKDRWRIMRLMELHREEGSD